MDNRAGMLRIPVRRRDANGKALLHGLARAPLSTVPRGVVGNESTGVTFNVDAAARQLASSSLVLVPTSLSSAPWLSISESLAIEASER